MPRVSPDLAAIVLAAGHGTRMMSQRPKVLHEVAGRSMIGHVIANVAALKPAKIVLVIGPEPTMPAIVEEARRVAPGIEIAAVVQHDRHGTGHAVRQAKTALAGHQGDVVVVFGDTPLVTTATLRKLVQARRKGKHAVTLAGFRPDNPLLFARLVLDAKGRLERVVEARDASAEERAIKLCNAGFMAAEARLLFDLVGRLKNENVKREYYLFDIVRMARQRDRACGVIEAEVEEAFGIDSRAALARAEAMIQQRLRDAAMAGGATLVAPETVFFSHDTRIGRDVVVAPHVVFGLGVEIGDGVEIRSFSHLERCSVAAGATVGPFARLRPGAAIGEGAHVGNFVEIKAASIEAGAKVNHLTYIGDARVGAKANIGAGTITCNYDGFEKFHTDIGAGAFIGSNSALVAPVKIGDGAYVASGSVVTADVPAGGLAVARGRQTVKETWAESFRSRRAAEKAAKLGRKD
jgi:bifunctional UDP-N-acetylglucosamine pyrophosphorylase/glucosamine-1-phosphate N-acetyltransferase